MRVIPQASCMRDLVLMMMSNPHIRNYIADVEINGDNFSIFSRILIYICHFDNLKKYNEYQKSYVVNLVFKYLKAFNYDYVETTCDVNAVFLAVQIISSADRWYTEKIDEISGVHEGSNDLKLMTLQHFLYKSIEHIVAMQHDINTERCDKFDSYDFTDAIKSFRRSYI